MVARWLLGCVLLGLAACGGVVRSSPDGSGATTTGGTASTSVAGKASTSMGGRISSSGGRTSTGGSPASAGQPSMGGQPAMLAQCGKRFCPAGEVCCNPVYDTCIPADSVPPIGACTQLHDDCASLSRTPAILSCVREFGALEPAMDPTVAVKVSVPSAVVQSEIVGALEGGCLEQSLMLQKNGPELSGQVMSWTISDGSRLWDVEVVVEGSKIPSLGGQKVSLNYFYQFGGFGPTRRELSVATLQSPSHGVWTAEGSDLPYLGKLPLVLSRGSATCTVNEQCGSYERYDLGAFDPLTMVTVSLVHSQTAAFGPWVLVHGGYEEQTSMGSMCNDWFVADVHVAILGLM